MAKASKRVRAFQEKVETGKPYAFDEAVALLKEFASKNFNETVEAAIRLGIDARKSDQAVRGAPRTAWSCLLYTSPSPRDRQKSRMPSSA